MNAPCVSLLVANHGKPVACMSDDALARRGLALEAIVAAPVDVFIIRGRT